MGSGLKATPSLYHCTVGIGFPLAVQYTTATLPTVVMNGDCCAMDTCGGSE